MLSSICELKNDMHDCFKIDWLSASFCGTEANGARGGERAFIETVAQAANHSGDPGFAYGGENNLD